MTIEMNRTGLMIRPVTTEIWRMIQEVAPAMFRSRLFGVGSVEQAAAIMLKGFELGMGLTASFEYVQIIQGKPTLSPRGALALIQRSGELEEMAVEDGADACTVYMKRRNGFSYRLTYTIEQAKRAGLVKPGGGWANYPENMLRWRAIGFVSDVVFPDILGGLKRADELEAAISPGGEVIDNEPVHVTDVRDMPGVTAETIAAGEAWLREQYKNGNIKRITLEDLVNTYGADDVLAAGGGQLPETEEDIERLAEVLAAGSNQGRGDPDD